MVYKKLNIFSSFLIFIIFTNPISAETDWRKYGWQIFDNAGDGRSIAMGNATVADIHINSTLWNPAIIGIGNSSNFTYGHQSRFAGIVQSDFLSYPFSSKIGRSFNLFSLMISCDFQKTSSSWT